MASKTHVTTNESFAVWGSGFKANEPVLLSVMFDSRSQVIIGGGTGAQVAANDAGAFAVQFDEIGGSAPSTGIKAIMAQGGEGSVASTPLMVVDTMVIPTSPGSSLAANPTATGGETTVWGAGFRPGEFVAIGAVGAAAGRDTIITGGESNISGAFELTVTIDLAPGIYTLRAIGDEGSTASAPLLITNPKE